MLSVLSFRLPFLIYIHFLLLYPEFFQVGQLVSSSIGILFVLTADILLELRGFFWARLMSLLR